MTVENVLLRKTGEAPMGHLAGRLPVSGLYVGQTGVLRFADMRYDKTCKWLVWYWLYGCKDGIPPDAIKCVSEVQFNQNVGWHVGKKPAGGVNSCFAASWGSDT